MSKELQTERVKVEDLKHTPEYVIVSNKTKKETHEAIWKRLADMPLYGE